MLNALQVFVLSLLKVATYFFKQWKPAGVGLLVGTGVRLSSQSWWGSAGLDAEFRRIAHHASEPMGYWMLALLGALAASLVYQRWTRYDGMQPNWFVQMCDNLVTSKAMPAIAAAGAGVVGASVPFGAHGIIFAVSFIVWLGVILCCLQVMAEHATMPRKS